MTLEKPLLQPARIGFGVGEARRPLALPNASAPAWLLRQGLEGLWMERVAEAAGRGTLSAGKKVGAVGAGAWRRLGGQVLERKTGVEPPVSSRHRPNYPRPSLRAGPSPLPPVFPEEAAPHPSRVLAATYCPPSIPKSFPEGAGFLIPLILKVLT